jgi:putative glutamine amidotransferase
MNDLPTDCRKMNKKQMAPIIGITCSMEYDQKGRKFPTAYAFDFLKRSYYEAVERAGGVPVLLPNSRKTNNTLNFLQLLDGLLISGGNDVDPVFYGEKREARNLSITPERDIFELSLVKKAGEKKIPLLAICRGMQLLNVAFGGNLYQDFSTERNFRDHTLEGLTIYKKRHAIVIQKESRLFDIIRRRRIMVNTSHHQMVKNVGRGLIASAWSEEDGVIEAIETEENHPFLGVQWHPELMMDRNSIVLFDWLIRSARKYKVKKTISVSQR